MRRQRPKAAASKSLTAKRNRAGATAGEIATANRLMGTI